MVAVLLSAQKKSILWFFSRVKKGNEPQLASIQDGLVQQTLRCRHFVPPCPRDACHVGHTLERWKKDSFKFPLYQYLWENGLTNSETWRCPDADERERLLGFRPDHSRTAMSTSAKNCELENARLRLLGSAAHTGLLAFLFAVFPRHSTFLAGKQERSAQTQESTSSEKYFDDRNIQVAKCGLGSLEHPGALPRSSLRPAWWKWRKVLWLCVKASQHINVLELRAVINGVLWRLRSASNIHSKGVLAIYSMVILGALAKGRSASRRLAPLGMKFNSLMVAASFTPVTRELPDGPQSGRWAQSPWLKIISAAPLERRTGSDYERPPDFCVTV